MSVFADLTKRSEPWPSWKYLWLALPWTIGIIWFSAGAFRAREAASRQDTVEGTYTAYDLDNHHSCRYQYVVSGKRYEDETGCPDPLPKLGNGLTVYYDKSDPAYGSTEDFNTLATNTSGPCFLMGTGVAALFAAIAFSKRQQRRQARK
jgi:hypothetical protein